ncbi:hypothetical protein D3OALGA1CA_650 [Olavius algarvensis associated proteobacterium Delta 3]|nr:hypothetical protein D3OALGA1CA_650 [Olavius algarvensis associated proteobacterium Delta 3]
MKRKRLIITFYAFITLLLCHFDLARPETSIPDLIDKAKPSIIHILTFDSNKKPVGNGTGFYISSDGGILTNYHVVNDSEYIVIKDLSENYLPTLIIDSNEILDIALLSLVLPNGSQVPPLKLSEKKPRVGEKIIVVGHPRGLEYTASDGMVSAIREGLVQFTAPISPGSSGSPVLNMNGEVIGIVALFLKESQNLNFAVSSKVILEKFLVLSSLRDDKFRGKPISNCRLYVTTNPEDAKIRILNIKQVFYQGIKLAAGQYHLEVSAPAYHTHKSWITMEGERHISIDLKPIPGRLYISTDPKDADIEFIGTPNSFQDGMDIDPGRYCLRISADGFQIKKECVEIKPDKGKLLFVILEPFKEPKDYYSTYEDKPTEIKSNGNNEKKIEIIERPSSTGNPDAFKWERKSQQAVNKGDWIEAIRTASVAISLDPGRPAPYINRAWAYINKGYYLKATEDCKVALLIDSSQISAYINLSNAYIGTGDYREALESARRAILLSPNNPLALNNRGLAYEHLGEIDSANNDYKSACEKGLKLACENFKKLVGYAPSEIPKMVENLIAESNLAFNRGAFEETLRLSNEALKWESENVEALTNRAAAYCGLKMLKEALEDCNKAIMLNPDYCLAYNNRGYAYELSEKIREAKLEYEISCELGCDLGCKNYQRLKFQ